MKTTRHLYAILGLVTILTAVSLSSTHVKAAPAQPQTVQVVNTNASPVPTTVTSLPAVQIASGQTVGITGTPNVNVLSVPAVQIGNDSSNPVPVSLAGSTHVPAGVAASFLIPDGESSGGDSNVFVVPAGKNLVITGLFGTAFLQPGQTVVLARLNFFPLIFTPTGQTDGRDVFVSSMQVNYILPAGMVVSVSGTASGIGPESMVIGFNGYLEDAS